MKYSLLVVVFILLAVPVLAQQNVPEIPYDSVPDFLKYPAEMNLGELSGVAVNSQGHVFALSRSNITGPAFGALATQLLEFDKDGKYLREIGKGLYGFVFAHNVRVDRNDNVWVVDKGSNMIMRFNPFGHVTMTLGRKEENVHEHAYPERAKAVHVDGYYAEPTDIAWDSNGNMYISDGYINSRVAKINKDGEWVKSFGTAGNGPGQFNTPHNIGIDRNNNVYVADRGNARIQVFDTDGNFQRQIKINIPAPPGTVATLGNTTNPPGGTQSAGAPWTICITNGPTQYLYTSDSFPGRIYKLTLDGKVVGMLGKGGRQLGQFNWLHELACPSENELIVADLNNWRVQKLILHPEKQTSSRD